MRSSIVLTLTGADRVGIVEEVTKVLLDSGANVETSRMARLGGEFAMLMLVSVPPSQADAVDGALARLGESGYKVTTTQTQHARAESHVGWRAYRIEVDGADHEGIVHDLVSGLSRRGISIESMETSVSAAPVSGTPLFAMNAAVVVPPDLPESQWLSALDDAARQSNVDVRVSAL